jgi:hypothetical protein
MVFERCRSAAGWADMALSQVVDRWVEDRTISLARSSSCLERERSWSDNRRLRGGGEVGWYDATFVDKGRR